MVKLGFLIILLSLVSARNPQGPALPLGLFVLGILMIGVGIVTNLQDSISCPVGYGANC